MDINTFYKPRIFGPENEFKSITHIISHIRTLPCPIKKSHIMI